MNFYCITYRLDSDKCNQKRYWESFATDKNNAIELLSDYIVKQFQGGQSELFYAPQILILSFNEYLDIFK